MWTLGDVARWVVSWSIKEVIPMAQLLEPSFADAIAAIAQAKALPASKRTHWCCSLRSIAKALDRQPETIAARWVAVAQQVTCRASGNSGPERVVHLSSLTLLDPRYEQLPNHRQNNRAEKQSSNAVGNGAADKSD